MTGKMQEIDLQVHGSQATVGLGGLPNGCYSIKVTLDNGMAHADYFIKL
ncbi:MAG: hypothetical protein HYZ16_01230 [Bacteroidetes bacterium]|nr:hypothetical protein [Bacteroidota bacterium]